MRFAGNKIEDFFGANRPDYGKTADRMHALRSDEKTAATGMMGELGAAGIGAQAKAKAANTGSRAQLAQGQAMGQAFSSIGSSIAGGIGTLTQPLLVITLKYTRRFLSRVRTKQHGTFQNPTADFQRAGFTLSYN